MQNECEVATRHLPSILTLPRLGFAPFEHDGCISRLKDKQSVGRVIFSSCEDDVKVSCPLLTEGA